MAKIFAQWWQVSIIIVIISSTSAVSADEFNLAVATNFHDTAKRLVNLFAKRTGHQAIITAGSTGKLYNQLKEKKASFDIFLSADVETPQLIEKQGLGVDNTRFSYAIGKLVLWSPQEGLVDAKGEILQQGKFEHLSIADPQVGPYGVIAQEVMANLSVWEKLQSKLLLHENMTTTYQTIKKGESQLGFVALSMLDPNQKIVGSFWVVPTNLYTPIEQQAILLQAGKNNKAALAFLDFLKTPRARNTIESYGYGLP
ncbi:MAG: molybdate ABC transporter substrate-binding protein [Thioploca sp.]|nr:molybdate ABC transporter substrate-binding protein [Thioploca sp.]